MKPFIVLCCVLLTAAAAFADPYSIMKRQARNAANAGSSQPDIPPQPSAPPQNNPASDPVLQATLQNIEGLRNDFAEIVVSTNSETIAAQKQSLTNNLTAAAQGVKPSPESISKLADDLATAVGGNVKLRAQLPKLAQYVHAVFNGSHLTATQQEMIFNDTRKILTGGGVSPDDAGNVVNDLKTIATETK